MDFKITTWEPWDIQGKFFNKMLVVISAFEGDEKVAILHGTITPEEFGKWNLEIDALEVSTMGTVKRETNDRRWTIGELQAMNTIGKKFKHRHKSIARFTETVTGTHNATSYESVEQQILSI